MPECVFCSIPEDEVIAQNDLALAFFDRYPVNRGHVLIIPKRHVATYFDATPSETKAIANLLAEIPEKQAEPEGFNQ